jgi:hypothetical protein
MLLYLGHTSLLTDITSPTRYKTQHILHWWTLKKYDNDTQDSMEEGERRDSKLLKEDLLQGFKHVLRLLKLHR